ncbi:MAG: acyl-CoA dehydrogenase family protein [Hyphomicrobiaceae bacterium]
MDLLLSDEQRMLQDSAAKFLSRHGGVKRTRSLRDTTDGFDRSVHREMAEEGWLSILVAPEAGGIGLGLYELAIVLEQTGRALAPEPLAATTVAAAAIAEGNQFPGAAQLCEQILAGNAIVAPALSIEGRPVKATRIDGSTIRLEGSIDDAPVGKSSDGYLIPAATDDGAVLCHVRTGAPGVNVSDNATVDSRPRGTISLDGASTADILAHGREASKATDRLVTRLLVATSAELLGVMSAALDMTLEHLRTRKQFGRPIGSFQALQHRAVDDFTHIVSVRSLLFQLAAQGDAILPSMASALKAHAADAALSVTKSAIQLHGAIGFTDEHDAGLYLKRAMWLSAWLGNAAVHRRRFADLTA